VDCLIGIPVAVDDQGRWREGRTYHYLDAAYSRAIIEAGALPVYLPLQRDALSMVQQLDGLLLPGGDDLLPPDPYPDHVTFDPVPGPQLAHDRALLRAALDQGLPILGICYGMQLIALERGGSLHYDIATDCPGALKHQLDAEESPKQRHPLQVEAGSIMARLIGDDPEPVNSQHHQAVADPGPEMRATARSPDGVIEAMEAYERRFCVGVQWHPERLHNEASLTLFRAFIFEAQRGTPG